LLKSRIASIQDDKTLGRQVLDEVENLQLNQVIQGDKYHQAEDQGNTNAKAVLLGAVSEWSAAHELDDVE
jgi:hypothetical protein